MNAPIRLLQLLVVLLAVALPLAGCGGDGGESSVDKAARLAAEQRKNPPTVSDVTTPPVNAEKVAPGPGEGDIAGKPRIPAQSGEPPSDLVAQDVIVGDGAEAKEGDTVSVRYVGVLFDGGKEFDSSWSRGKNELFDFEIGGAQVIQGWDQGIAGMREGGRRRLIIPSDLAYGAQGSPPTIPANAALVFDVDLVKVKSAG
ncbi:MAG: FKBP-type peptidyl-prolyl cis-trans isomerase [Solirubrobacteraceae bacterium]|nr:FKBP-type peptidyl-prolyl cis-trans isomerase [Solirubrobacteraceae bacterium]